MGRNTKLENVVNSEANLLSLEEELSLFKRIKKGDEKALHTLVLCHQHMVDQMAESRARRFPVNQEILNDYKQAGYIGLYKATETWNASAGRFRAYARSFVHGEMVDVQWGRNLIAVPESMRKNSTKFHNAEREILNSGMELSMVDLAGKSGLSVKQTNEMASYLEDRDSLAKGGLDELSYDVIQNVDSISPEEELTESEVSVPDRIWEFTEQEVGFVIPKVATYLTEEASELVDIPTGKDYSIAVRQADRCIRRRQVFLNGSRGKFDFSSLDTLRKETLGIEVYDHRRIWKDGVDQP